MLTPGASNLGGDGSCGGSSRCWSSSCWSRSGCCRCCCWLSTSWSELDFKKLSTRLHSGAILHQQLGDHPRSRGGHRDRSLVSLNFTKDLIFRNGVANCLLPSQVTLRDGVCKGGANDHFHLISKNPCGKDTPPNHWVLVEQGSSWQHWGPRSLGSLCGLGGKHREVSPISGLVDPPEDAPGAYPARP